MYQIASKQPHNSMNGRYGVWCDSVLLCGHCLPSIGVVLKAKKATGSGWRGHCEKPPAWRHLEQLLRSHDSFDAIQIPRSPAGRGECSVSCASNLPQAAQQLAHRYNGTRKTSGPLCASLWARASSGDDRKRTLTAHRFVHGLFALRRAIREADTQRV